MRSTHTRRILSLLVVVAAVVLAGPAPAGAGAGKTFLWKIRSAKTTAYLLGSIHVAKPDLYPLDPRIEKAFESSAVLVVEADASGMGGLAAATEMLSRGTYPEGDGLERHVSAGLFRETRARMQKYGIPLEQWTRHKPWLVATTITMLELQGIGISPENGIDLHFLGRARGKKTIVELESAAAQIALLDGFDERQQELFLKYTLRDADNLSEHIGEMFDTWHRGDAPGLEKLLSEPLREASDLEPIYEKLLDDRNVEMARKIRELLEDRQVHFIVVGAGHLVGTKGLLELLKPHFEIEQL